MIRDRFGLLQGQLDRHRLGPMGAPAGEARRGAVEALAHHQIGPVLPEQLRQLADHGIHGLLRAAMPRSVSSTSGSRCWLA